MSKPMTPTEQDKELEAQLDKIFPCDCSFMKGFAFRPEDPCDGSCVNAPYRKAVLQLITADRKRVALEERIDSLLAAKRRIYETDAFELGLALGIIDSELKKLGWTPGELKAQQEEV